MDRKAWIIIILCLGGLFWSQYEVQKQAKAYQSAQAQLAAEKAKTAAAQPTPLVSNSTPAIAGAVTAVSESPTTLVLPATTHQLHTPLAEYTFTSAGGLQSVELLGHKGETGGHVVINGTSDVPICVIADEPGKWSKTSETVKEVSEKAITLESILPSGVQIRKTFTLGKSDVVKDDYQLKYDVTFSNPGVAKLDVKPWYVSTGAAAPIHERDQPRYISFDYQAGAKTIYKNITNFEAGRIPLIGIQTSPEKPEIREAAATGILWAGTKNQYFSTMLQPLGDLRGDSIWTSRYALPQKTPDAPKHYAITGALGFPAFSLAPGESKTQSFTFYAGPKEYSRLKTLGNEQEGVMEFGFFGFFSSTLLQAMNWIHGFVKNYGIAIIVLTLIIKTALWTIQNKSMKSMKKMSLLAPKMNELKVKYKDDPTRMNTEVMKLYKDYGVNPFAGCLPMLVQMPVFFGFYSMLAVAVELRNSSFLWVNDLSQPDTVAHLGSIPINVFPLVMAVTMLWQMQLTPKTGDSSQQKIFMFMPIFFLFICYNYASALALYWTVQNIFSIVQLYLTRNAPLPELVKVNSVPANAKLAKAKR
ncbi:MAG: membrane protein insertase YidC [Chthoniobacterales bacterium]